jgi:hypothetical protein
MDNEAAPKAPPVGLVTIDVEPDNVWSNTQSQSLENVRFLSRFQCLCREYGIRPTYLVSWSVAADGAAARVVEALLAAGDCEVGIHPHLWETPPIVSQDGEGRAWVGADYALDVLEGKLAGLVTLVKHRFGSPVSHRAGRWGLESRQVAMLGSLGLRVDTSVTPGIDWTSTGAPNYTKAPCRPYRMGCDDLCRPGDSQILQVPCTVKPGQRFFGFEKTRFGSALFRRAGLGQKWLRVAPSLETADLLEACAWASARLPHLNLMSHSSEFMAGGSPYWRTGADVARQFEAYRCIFTWWGKNGVKPQTLAEFAAGHEAPAEEAW